MWKKFFILTLFIAVFFAFLTPISSVNAGDHRHFRSIPIKWRIAGPILDSSIIHLRAIGSPGRADLTIYGHGIDFEQSGWTEECNDGDFGKLVFAVNGIDFVAVFNDLSMLFATHSEGGGYVCRKLGNEPSEMKIDMEIIGGTGRFKGAGGYFTAEGTGCGHYFPEDSPLSAEIGKFTGEIIFED